MKKVILLLAGLLAAPVLYAQLANPGFELFNANGAPAFWRSSSDISIPIGSTCSWTGADSMAFFTHDAHSGSYACELRVATYCTDAYGGNIRSARYPNDTFAESRIAFAGRPAAFTFYYKLLPISGDKGICLITLEDDPGNIIADGALKLQQAAPGWTLATVPLHYYSNDTAGFLNISFRLSSDSTLHYGSHFLIDDIGEVATGIGTYEATIVAPSVFPVPAKDQVSVRLPLDAGSATCTLYNSLGQVVRLVEWNGTTGLINLSGLPAGLYHYRLNSHACAYPPGIIIKE